MSCPKCGSEEWKSAEFVYKSGLSDVDTNTTTVGAGGGVGTGGVGAGIGVAGSSTNGTHQTRLSSEFSPPEEPKDNQATIYWVVAFIFAGMVSGKSEFIGSLIFIGAIYLWVTKFKDMIKEDYKDQVKKYKKDITNWGVTRVCQRCGNSYVTKNTVVIKS